MGNASVACQPSYGPSKNIAFIPVEKKSFLSFGIANNYHIKDLSPAFITFLKSFGGNTSLQLSAVRMGNNFFSEQFAEAGLAKRINSKITAGISIKYHQWILKESIYVNSNTLIPSFGILIFPLKNISFGVLVRNPVRVRMNSIEENKLPAQINPGFSIKVSEKVSLACSAIQQNDLPLSTQLGLEYMFHPKLFFRTGWHTVPHTLTFGFGLKLKRFCLDTSLQTHSVLGNSTAVALTFGL